MSPISTHILNTAAGTPAAGVRVHLFLGEEKVNSDRTNPDGRCPNLLPAGFFFKGGNYSIVFETESIFESCFYPKIRIEFRVDDPAAHYHVPLLISPFGYTTYRGS